MGEKCGTQIVLQYYVSMYTILCFNRNILHILYIYVIICKVTYSVRAQNILKYYLTIYGESVSYCKLCCYLVSKSCPTFCDSMDCSPSDSVCQWNFPGKNNGVDCHFLLWGSSQPRDQILISCIARRFFTNEPPARPSKQAQLLVFILYNECDQVIVTSGTLRSLLVFICAPKEMVLNTSCFSLSTKLLKLSSDYICLACHQAQRL